MQTTVATAIGGRMRQHNALQKKWSECEFRHEMGGAQAANVYPAGSIFSISAGKQEHVFFGGGLPFDIIL